MTEIDLEATELVLDDGRRVAGGTERRRKTKDAAVVKGRGGCRGANTPDALSPRS